MKILLVNHFPLEGSGSGTYTKNTAQHLAKRGHDVAVVFPENQEPAPLEGVTLYPVYFTNTMTDTTPADVTGEGVAGSLHNPLPFNFPCFTTHPRSLTTFDDLSVEEFDAYKDAFSTKIDEIAAEFKPDIIHGQHVWVLGDLASESGVPTVLTAHGTDMMGYRKWPRFHAYANEAVDNAIDIIAISRDNYEDTVETIPSAKDKMVLLLNGYNEDIFYQEPVDKKALLAEYGIDYEGQPIVLFAGKLTNFKGVDTLLKAVARYEKDHPDYLTLIAGDGEERDNLHQLAKDLDLKNLHFLGHQSQDQLRHLYNIADQFVVPSRREPFGLVALEAMACGAPVVATNQGGLPEFVTEDKGRLVDVDDDEGLATAIVEELTYTTKHPERKDAVAKSTYEGYAQSKFVAKLEELYKKALAKAEAK